MIHTTRGYFLFLFIVLFSACQNKPCTEVDTLIYNADIFTGENDPNPYSFIAISDGVIKGLGSSDEERQSYCPIESIDAGGNFLMPGLIEGHGHFSSMGMSMINLDLSQTQSWSEIVSLVEEKTKNTPKGKWILGRGWHQEKWIEDPGESYNGYPYHFELSKITPDHPVWLEHASGHGLMANEKAMNIAGINAESVSPSGGRIVRDDDGRLTGVFEEEASMLIALAHQESIDNLEQEKILEEWYEAIELAQARCLQNGITSFQDAGSTVDEVNRYTDMAENGKLKVRLWAMLRDDVETMKTAAPKIKVKDAGNGFFTCNSIKAYVDGALGSFGAWLLKPYNDKPGFIGQNTTPLTEIKSVAEIALANGMQLCTHAIGDRANRLMLNLYEEVLTEKNQDKRWRIEHAQHINDLDIPRFRDLGIIASMQAIHCTSDAPFVVKRLGEERAREGAYAWRKLLDHGVRIANGTDVPVESINPLDCIYASVTRHRFLEPEQTFFPEQSMTRKEALLSYTIYNAYAAFEENSKGSLKPGKVADMILVDRNLISCEPEEILTANILKTMIDGKVVYQMEE